MPESLTVVSRNNANREAQVLVNLQQLFHWSKEVGV